MIDSITPSSRQAKVEAFLEKNRREIAAGGHGRLIFALDATASRQPTWDCAAKLQAQMFGAASGVSGLQVQLVFFRGVQCQTSDWTRDANSLAAKMRKIFCESGTTQWLRVLRHIRQEHRRNPVSVAVCIGDAFEESADEAYAAVAEAPKLVMVQEGDDPLVSAVFARLAEKTGGLHFKLGPDSTHELAELLRGLGAYAVGGPEALKRLSTNSARLLLAQLK